MATILTPLSCYQYSSACLEPTAFTLDTQPWDCWNFPLWVSFSLVICWTSFWSPLKWSSRLMNQTTLSVTMELDFKSLLAIKRQLNFHNRTGSNQICRATKISPKLCQTNTLWKNSSYKTKQSKNVVSILSKIAGDHSPFQTRQIFFLQWFKKRRRNRRN